MYYKYLSFMGKKDFSEAELVALAEKFKVLSEVSRLKIINTLTEGEICVKDIISRTELQQPNVSKQLKILMQAGIVSCRAEGLLKYYSLQDFTILQICNAVCGK